MKVPILFIAAFLLAGNAAAQVVTFPVNCPDGYSFKVQYLVENETSSVLLCRYEPDAATEGPAPYLKNLSRKTHISTPDGDYALISTRHLPLRDEADAKYAYLKGIDPSLNFALEFEKFPLDEPFDLIEDDSESSLTVSGLTADRQTAADVDTASFLAETPYSEYGYHFDNGEPVYYFDDGGIYLASTAWPYCYLDQHSLSVGMRIVNRTDAPLNVNFKDFSAQAQRLNKKNVPVNCGLIICNAKKANAEWKTADEVEMENELPTTPTDVVTSAAVITPGALGGALAIISLLAMTAPDPVKEPYMREKNQIREELMEQYLKDSVVPAGDTLSTFVTIKYNNEPSSTTVSFVLNGDEYIMKY